MAKQEKQEAGNNSIETESELVDGYYNSNLYCYDPHRQLPRPLTSEAIRTFVMCNLFNQRATPQWSTGFVFGWIAALCEHNPVFFFTSIVIPGSLPIVLQET